MIRSLLVVRIVEALRHERFEHLQTVVGRTGARPLGGLVQHRVQQRTEQLPVQQGIQAAQGFDLGQEPWHAPFHIEETGNFAERVFMPSKQQ